MAYYVTVEHLKLGLCITTTSLNDGNKRVNIETSESNKCIYLFQITLGERGQIQNS